MNDCINREALLKKMADYVASGYADSAEDFEEYSRIVCQMPSVIPTGLKVIEDIKQEIEQRIPKVEYDIGNGLAIAISIINNHTKGEQ